MSAPAEAVADSMEIFAGRVGNVGAVAVIVAEMLQDQRDTTPTTMRCVYAIRDLAVSLEADLIAASEAARRAG